MNTKRTCPECGKPVAPNGLQGLCPECMMKVGLAAQTGEAGPGGTQVVPPQPKPPPTLAQVAQLFPQLEILECLGCGGMGAVYKARQPRLDRLVALKILTGDREDATRDSRFAERFEREARALAKLSHPNIVAMYEFGQAGGMPYFVMEHVEGLNLRQLEQAGKLSPRQALQIIPQICEALQFAHDEGIVHRDIKPENILLDKKGRVKIADFGIAKIMGGTPLIGSDAEKLATKPGEGLTQDQILGTPHYMAPEQAEHPQTVDHRADIYSLGVVFYEMLTGELPLGKFQPPSSRIRGMQIDVRLDEIVLHALEKEPERRYQHASEVKTDVETIRSTAAPARSSAGGRRVRIPGTNLALVESRNGQRLVNWKNASLAWVLLMLAGALVLGLIVLVANVVGFYIKRDTLQTACAVMAFFYATVLGVAVRRALLLPADQFESPAPSAKASGETLDLERIKNARRLVKWPATGLMAIGLCFLVAGGCFLGFGYWPTNWQGALVLCCMGVIDYVILLGSWKMRRLQDYRLAVLAAIVSLVVASPGLPLAAFPIWALMVLYRPDVRAAFQDVARKGASETAATPASSSSASAPRPGVAWVTVTGVAAVALLAIVVALLAVYGPSRARQQEVSAGAVVGVQEILRREIQQRLAEGGWKVESLNVSVSPDLKRAECRFGTISKNGLTEVSLPHAPIYLKPQRHGLWLVRGEGEFEPLRFSVDTSAELAAVRDAPPPMTAPATSFGPVREVTLNDIDDLRGGEALDLDSGRLLDLPKDTEKRPESEQVQWLKEHSADVLLDNVNGRWGLLTPTDNILKLAPLPNEKWEVATERELSQALAAEPSGLEIKQVQSWTVYVLATNAQPPLTFAFQTASGASGLLQITRFGEKPNSVRLRYKLLQPAATVLASPREVVAEWLRRVKAGTREAWDLTTRSNNVGWGPYFTGLWEFDRIRPLHQLGSEDQAMVLSNPFKDNAGQPRIFYAVLRKRDGQWLVDRHDYVSPSQARSLMKGFAVNPGVKFDVLAAELVVEWRAACDSTISLAADGTGAQLRVGPGGPEPGAKPESFKWEVSGSTLRRHFADRDEKLEILWMDDNDVQFRSPNDSEWDAWWRTPQGDRPAPELQTTSQWKNSEPLTLAALRGKYVLLDFWGHWCAPCVRQIPTLMALHEHFSDRGLVVVGVHDASVSSIAEMDEKLSPIKKNLWMDHEIYYAVVIDRPDPARADAPNRRGTGATATAYGTERFPTLLLINPAGKLVGEFHATTLDAMIAQLEKLLHLKAGPPAWQSKFDQLYRLERGNLLRCIPEPFIPQRKEFFFYHYIRSGLMERAPASVTFEAPVSASFVWDAESQTIADVRQGPKTLLSLLGDIGFDEREIQGAAPLLEGNLSGDWIFARRFPGDWQRRADGEREALLTAFAQTLKDQFQLSLRFTPTIVERDAYKATGAWKLAPLGSQYSRSDVHLFTDKPDPPDSTSGGGGTGNLDEFLNYVGRLGRVSITNATGRTDGGKFSWRQHSSAQQAVLKNSKGAFEQLLARVSEQTGLRFEKFQQPERVWVVEKRA